MTAFHDIQHAPDERARDLAAMHAIDSLEGEERDEFRVHLAACRACRAEVASLRRVASALAELAPEVRAPASLRARLLERLASGPRAVDALPAAPQSAAPQSWKGWSADRSSATVLLLSADQSGWEATAFDGVEARKLFVDEAADRVTMLVRMAPGASYPPHVHGGPEECYVLAGDLDVGEARMTAGSYQRLGAGSRHPVQSTRDGCVLLLVSSLQDELLPA